MSATRGWEIDSDQLTEHECEAIENEICDFHFAPAAMDRADEMICAMGYELNSRHGSHDVTYSLHHCGWESR